nr:hypothetical protein [Mesorhizobium huakuii]
MLQTANAGWTPSPSNNATGAAIQTNLIDIPHGDRFLDFVPGARNQVEMYRKTFVSA